MAVMIPSEMSPDIKSNAEKHIFEWFKTAPGTDDWIVLHSLGITTHQRVIHGETDFLVLAPGKGMFAIEVKGGRVERHLGKWRFINKYGEFNEKVRSPFDQAWEGIYSIKSLLVARLDDKHEYLNEIIFGIGVMFPDIEYLSVGVDEEQCQVFDMNDGKNVSGFIDRIAQQAINTRKRLEYPIKPEMFPTKADVNYIAQLLRGDFDIEVPLKIKQKYTEENLLSLTNEQAQCIEQLADNPRALIRGTAGTGKTMLAIEAAKRAIANGERVAFFCYNKMLGEWLKNYFSTYPEDQRPHFVGSFHSFMIHLLLAKGIYIQMPNGKSEKDFFENELPENTMRVLKKEPVYYDRLIVDEAQDLLTESYLDVMDLCLRDGLQQGIWMLFGDFSMQAIYSSDGKNEFDFIETIQSRANFAIFRLTKNCRNTKKICLDIENIVGIKENAAFKDTIDTPAVDHEVYVNMEDQKSKLISLINNLLDRNVQPSDIVILSPRTFSDSVVSKLGGEIIEEYSVDTYGKIRFSTIHAFKGLESSTIIITDIESYDDEKLIYVGLSRATFDLHILESMKANEERAKLFFTRRIQTYGR
ncbi:MAG: NERD domain-containing protein/DEAD/DEAH box helicase [Erysipelotrichaceae bacterium]|nr:NERD domain-containing protein/DEAD/DEAH box helicase [Erysipelotrichaceae bacterium]